MTTVSHLATRHKYGRRLYMSLVFFILLAAYIHIQALKSPYIGLVLKPLPGSGWRIEAVDEGGLATDWRLQPGDRIVMLDPDAKLTREGEFYRLRQADYLSVARHAEGLINNYHPANRLFSAFILSLAMEALLLGLAVYALLRQPESAVIRSFFNLNYLLALVILSIYSPEGSLSQLLLTYCSIWLPYLLLSFYLQFIYRASVFRLQKLKSVFLLGTFTFTLVMTYFVVAEIEVFKWISDVLNWALLGTTLLLAGVTFRSWRLFDRVERNQLLMLFAGLLLSLLPYTFLYAIPVLFQEPFILPLKYALIGFVPFSLIFTFILVKRSMLDMRLHFPRLVVHVLYFTATFMLLVLSAGGVQLQLYVLFIVFIALTLLYQRGLLRYRRKTVVQGEKLDRQKRALSADLESRQATRELLALLTEIVSKRLGIQDVCLLWQDSPVTIVQGTGSYKGIEGEPLEPDYRRPEEVMSWLISIGLSRLIELRSPSGSGVTLGYIGIRNDSSAFSEKEVEELLREAAELVVRFMYQAASGQRVAPLDRSLLESQEAERIRTSHFLHDRLLQNLIFVSRDLEELYDTGKPDKERVALWLKSIYESQSDIRALCDDLHPPIIDHGDLRSAVEWLIRSMKQRSQDGVEAELVYELEPHEPRNELIKSNLFRAIRELVNNVFKHAGATRLTIHLWRDGSYLYCGVRDNGRGFDVATVMAPSAAGERRFGIHSLYNQIRQLGGETDIHSIPGKGTSVHLMLPLDREELTNAVQN